MKRSIPLALAACLALCGASFAAQVTWDDEQCSNVVTFDNKKVDATALRNTVNLLFAQSEIRAPTGVGLMFTPEQAAQADLAALEKECAEIERAGAALKLIALPGLEDFRTLRREEARDACALNIVLIRALKNPAALRDYKPAAPKCTPYVDGLEGNLDQIWRKTLDDICKKNGSPAKCRANEQAEAAKPDGAERKRLLVINFGWNNCAVNFMTMHTGANRREKLRKDIEKAFRKQFKVAKRNCQVGD